MHTQVKPIQKTNTPLDHDRNKADSSEQKSIVDEGEQANGEDRVRRVQRVAKVMDEALRIPGTGRRIGLDSLVGLIPGVGDLATATVSAYIIREAWMLGLPKRKLANMVFNVVIDMAVGAIPLVGDLFDFAFKANTRNVAIIRNHLQR